MWVLLKSHDLEELPMQTVTTIGLDIAKSVFSVQCFSFRSAIVLSIGHPRSGYKGKL